MAENAPKAPFEIPGEMRDLAHRSLEQAKRAVDTFVTAAEKAASTTEQSVSNVQSSAMDMAQKSVGFAAQNMTASIEMMQRLVQAKGFEEVMRIQGEFVQSQMRVFQDQARSLGGHMQEAAEKMRGKIAK